MRIFLSLLLLFLVFVPPALAEEEGEREVLYWHDPMYPKTKFDKPGKSPFMDMDLVPVYEDEVNGGPGAPENAIKIDPVYIQTLGVKTAEVKPEIFGRNIRAFGRFVPSTRLQHIIDLRAAGWIIDLKTDAVGDTVGKGDLLFTLYSPDLMSAQSDFLLGRRIGNAKQRLRLFGMDDKAIEELKRKGRFLEETPFYAPIDGTITALHIRPGSHVKEGGSVLSIQDFSKLWVNVDVPIRDAQFLITGTPATVTVPETGAHYETTVDFIHPVNDPQARTAMVRMILDNPDGALKPGTYVDAVFRADVQTRLAVPAEAVLYGGMGAYVMEDAGEGYFRPVMVETGITAGGLTEIKTGLKRGQRIVTSGQFMLDAESNLRGGMAAMGGGHDH